MIALVKRFLSLQVARYGIVGISNTLFSYGVYALVVFLGFRYHIASIVSIVVGIIFSFITQGAVVFKGISTAAFIRYVLVWCVLYFVNILLIDLLVKLSLDVYQAGAVATLPIVMLAYFFMKHFVFRLRSDLLD
jgi:putative flippase GtrA